MKQHIIFLGKMWQWLKKRRRAQPAATPIPAGSRSWRSVGPTMPSVANQAAAASNTLRPGESS